MSERTGPPIEAVTFDYWNTLIYETPGHLRTRRIDAWLDILTAADTEIGREHLDELFDRSWQAYVDNWKSNRQFQADEAAREVAGALGVSLRPALIDELVDAFIEAGRDAELHTTEGIEGCLRKLKDAGVKVGIVCDVGMTASPFLRGHLDRHGLLGLFDHWSFSDEVGAYKPSPVIFRHALDGLGVADPTRAAHVGDLRRTDIAGARAMGMTAVRYVGVFDDDTQPEPEGHFVTRDHADLPGVLGIG